MQYGKKSTYLFRQFTLFWASSNQFQIFKSDVHNIYFNTTLPFAFCFPEWSLSYLDEFLYNTSEKILIMKFLIMEVAVRSHIWGENTSIALFQRKLMSSTQNELTSITPTIFYINQNTRTSFPHLATEKWAASLQPQSKWLHCDMFTSSVISSYNYSMFSV